jgi:type I restriction enzyme S subunit
VSSFGCTDCNYSGIEWLGVVPSHWQIRKLSHLFRAGKGSKGQMLTKEFCSANDGVYPVYSGQTENNGVMGTWNQFEFDFGDKGVLFATTVGAKAMELRQLFGKFSLSQNCMIIWPMSSACDTRFFYYHFQPLFRYYRSMLSEHMQASFRMEDLYSYRVAVPSMEEQRNIASFLDQETSKIDALITEQQRLIELLKEKRQAVISHAVTKGLNPDVRMKPSGVEWLGEVPEHWEVRRLKNLLSESLKYGANESAELDDPTLPRFVRITDIDEDGNLRDETFRSLPREVAQPYLLHEGDVLLARSGATVGKSFKYSNRWGEACFAGYLIRARLKTQLCLPDWLNYFCQTNAYWGYVVGSQIQATIQNVSAEKYDNLYLPVPSIGEQRAIIEALDDELARLKNLIDDAAKAIILLQERRTALISAAVTGKIDVRNYASTQKDAA